MNKMEPKKEHATYLRGVIVEIDFAVFEHTNNKGFSINLARYLDQSLVIL